mmetsp:Transcript_26703/g.46020  ORF Transcript_26703/g.46020 Transcript_26703/m.46020 type:complete len:253 (-) Transcript_26703:1064-1822(-)
MWRGGRERGGGRERCAQGCASVWVGGGKAKHKKKGREKEKGERDRGETQSGWIRRKGKPVGVWVSEKARQTTRTRGDKGRMLERERGCMRVWGDGQRREGRRGSISTWAQQTRLAGTSEKVAEEDECGMYFVCEDARKRAVGWTRSSRGRDTAARRGPVVARGGPFGPPCGAAAASVRLCVCGSTNSSGARRRMGAGEARYTKQYLNQIPKTASWSSTDDLLEPAGPSKHVCVCVCVCEHVAWQNKTTTKEK